MDITMSTTNSINLLLNKWDRWWKCKLFYNGSTQPGLRPLFMNHALGSTNHLMALLHHPIVLYQSNNRLNCSIKPQSQGQDLVSLFYKGYSKKGGEQLNRLLFKEYNSIELIEKIRRIRLYLSPISFKGDFWRFFEFLSNLKWSPTSKMFWTDIYTFWRSNKLVVIEHLCAFNTLSVDWKEIIDRPLAQSNRSKSHSANCSSLIGQPTRKIDLA